MNPFNPLICGKTKNRKSTILNLNGPTKKIFFFFILNVSQF